MKKGLIYIVITALMFSIFEPVGKLIADDVSPETITFVRFLIGGIFLLPLSLGTLRRRGLKLTARDHSIMLTLGVLLICLSMILLQYAVKISSSPALIAIIYSCNPIFTMLLSSLFIREKVTLRQLAAIALCLVGLVICSAKNLSNAADLRSIVLAVLSAVAFSTYTVINRALSARLDGSITLSFSFLYGSSVLLLYLLLAGKNPVDGIAAEHIPALLVLSFGVTCIGFFCFLTAIKKTSAVYASFAFFCKPVLAPFAALLIVGTPLNAYVFLGLVFVLAGLYILNTPKRV